MKLNTKFILVILVSCITILASCTKDKVLHEIAGPEQLAMGRLNGTWASPSNIVTPDGVPAEVFGTMRLVFTTDESGNPSQFLAQGCPIIFGNAGTGSWTVTGDQENAQVKLVGIEPVDEFTAKVSGTTLTLSFYMGWENTDTQETGQGNFQVTLIRQQ